MKYVCFLLLLIVLGCKNFDEKKISSEEIVEEELKHFNWEEVESYPAFLECDNLEKQEIKACFENRLSQEIYLSLQERKVILSDSIQEKMLLFVSISKEGKPSLDSIEVSRLIEKKMPEMQSWLKQSIQQLPKIYPARKRGIPVKTSFKLPLIISSE